MKKFYLIVLTIFLASATFAAGVKTLKASTWDIANPNSWAPYGLPGSGDTVIIPAGKQLIAAGSFSFPINVYLKVYGEIVMTGTPIDVYFDATSTIIVYGGGDIKGTSSTQKMYLNGQQIFSGTTTVNGAMWANVTTNGFVPYNTLPVKFVGFSATRKASDVLVQWSTSEEVNAAYYQLERSFDGISFTSIAQLKAAGTSSVVTSYSYTDKANTAPTSFYRVRQVDANGQATYTAVKTVKNESTATASVSIAAIQQKVVLQFPAEVKGTIVVRVVNLSGQVVETQTLQGAQGQVVLNTRAKGHNIIALSNGAELNTARQVVL